MADSRGAVLAQLNKTYPKHMTGTTGASLSPVQLRQLFEAVGFTPKLALQMMQITKGESSFMPGIVQTDPGDGNVGYGLTQVTPHAWGPEAVAHMNSLGGVQAMLNPVKNAQMAKWLSDQSARGGGNPLGPWYGTKYLNRNPGPVHSVLGVTTANVGSIPTVPGASSTPKIPKAGAATVPANTAARGAAIRDFLFSKQDPLTLAANLKAAGPATVRVAAPAASPSVPKPSPSVGVAGVPKVKGVANFEGHQVAAWIAPVLQYARSKGWKGTVNSGFRTLADQTRIYNSGVRPAARPGTSNHEFTAFPGGAVDVSDAQTLSNILLGSKYKSLLVYAGSKDPVHFSHPHNGAY